MHIPSLKILIYSLSILFSTSAWSSDVTTILNKKNAPSGVVFEIVSGEKGLLSKLLPIMKTDIKKLRDRFPEIPIAIVTHGTEQFDLTIKNRSKQNIAHGVVEELVKANDVEVHVCGTHAGWFGIEPEDFPDYVDVTPAGPTQINHYEELGYELIILP